MSGRIRMLMCIGVQQGKACNGHLSSCRILLLEEGPQELFLADIPGWPVLAACCAGHRRGRRAWDARHESL